MKKAEEILIKNCRYFDLGITEQEAISAMKEYATAVSIEVLQTVISNLDDSMIDFGGLAEEHKLTILSTPIITP